MYVNSKAQVCPLDIGQPSLRYERRRPVIQCPVEVKFCQVITSPPPKKVLSILCIIRLTFLCLCTKGNLLIIYDYIKRNS